MTHPTFIIVGLYYTLYSLNTWIVLTAAASRHKVCARLALLLRAVKRNIFQTKNILKTRNACSSSDYEENEWLHAESCVSVTSEREHFFFFFTFPFVTRKAFKSLFYCTKSISTKVVKKCQGRRRKLLNICHVPVNLMTRPL